MLNIEEKSADVASALDSSRGEGVGSFCGYAAEREEIPMKLSEKQGGVLLMLLAALQGVSTEMYEAADIDGATAWQKLIYVTLPSVKNTIFVTGLLRVIWVANSVDVIFNMTEGGPAYSTQTLSVYIFNKGNALDLGYASAMALLMAALLLVVAIPYLKMNFREEG